MLKRSLVVGAMSLALVMPTTSSAQVTHHRTNPQADGPCHQLRTLVTHDLSHDVMERRVRFTIHCATQRWSVPGGYAKALAVATCESSLYPWALSNGNYGLFQIRDFSTRLHVWMHRRHWWFPPWQRRIHPLEPKWSQARANVLVAIRWVHVTRSWSPWSCA